MNIFEQFTVDTQCSGGTCYVRYYIGPEHIGYIVYRYTITNGVATLTQGKNHIGEVFKRMTDINGLPNMIPFDTYYDQLIEHTKQQAHNTLGA